MRYTDPEGPPIMVPDTPNVHPSEENPAEWRIQDGRPDCRAEVPAGSRTMDESRDRPTFDRIVAERGDGLVRYAARLLQHSDLAQDVVQTAFLRLLDHWDRLSSEPARIGPWLYRTVHNLCVDFIRREERRQRAHEAWSRDPVLERRPQNPSELSASAERRRWVEEQLERLTPGEREVLILRLEHGWSYRDIARITGRTVGNVGCLLHNATKKLARALKEAGWT